MPRGRIRSGPSLATELTSVRDFVSLQSHRRDRESGRCEARWCLECSYRARTPPISPGQDGGHAMVDGPEQFVCRSRDDGARRYRVVLGDPFHIDPDTREGEGFSRPARRRAWGACRTPCATTRRSRRRARGSACVLKESRNEGFSATVSARALIMRLPMERFLAQKGISPQRMNPARRGLVTPINREDVLGGGDVIG